MPDRADQLPRIEALTTPEVWGQWGRSQTRELINLLRHYGTYSPRPGQFIKVDEAVGSPLQPHLMVAAAFPKGPWIAYHPPQRTVADQVFPPQCQLYAGIEKEADRCLKVQGTHTCCLRNGPCNDGTCKHVCSCGHSWWSSESTVPHVNEPLTETSVVYDPTAVPEAKEAVDHPAHYGGADDPYEAIKVIEAWDLSFCLGNTVKYINRADRKGHKLEDLKKARWYLDREITNLETE